MVYNLSHEILESTAAYVMCFDTNYLNCRCQKHCFLWLTGAGACQEVFSSLEILDTHIAVPYVASISNESYGKMQVQNM